MNTQVRQNFPQGEDTMEPGALEKQRKAVINFIIKWIHRYIHASHILGKTEEECESPSFRTDTLFVEQRCASQDFFSSKRKFANPLWKNLQKFIKELETQHFKEFSAALVETVQKKTSKDDNQKETVFHGDDDVEYTGLVWNITQTLWPRSLVPGEFKVSLFAYDMTQNRLIEPPQTVPGFAPPRSSTCDDIYRVQSLRKYPAH